jgi:hypothetical protein
MELDFLEMRMNLYCFWTGSNPMSDNRRRCFETLHRSGLNVVLVTPDNLNDFLVEPLHPGFQHLSEVHKADYLRTYFMHFHGGAYADIKEICDSWLPSVELLKDPNIWIVGLQEPAESGMPLLEDRELDKIVRANWQKLIANNAMICKPNTPFTQEWYSGLLKKMDAKYDQLVAYPGRHPMEGYGVVAPNSPTGYLYPFRWAEILGEIFHPICYKYNSHVQRGIPSPINSNPIYYR